MCSKPSYITLNTHQIYRTPLRDRVQKRVNKRVILIDSPLFPLPTLSPKKIILEIEKLLLDTLCQIVKLHLEMAERKIVRTVLR